MKKLVYISSIATSQQIKFCEALQGYVRAEFWFYEFPDRTRGSFWRVELGQHCRVLDRVAFAKDGFMAGRYLCFSLSRDLERFDPDIVMLGGFSIPSNYLAYRWAKKRGKRIAVFTERSRTANGRLRKRSIIWRLIKWAYREIDLVIVSAEDVVDQFKREFCFGDKVIVGRYAADIDEYLLHPIRKPESSFTLIFANRLTKIYNPLLAIDLFSKLLEVYPNFKLLMNNAGEQRSECVSRVESLGIKESVEFLSNITTWQDLSPIYSRSDILILPAIFSNGNFTVLEAMASGMGLVISNKVLGIGQYVQDNVNGFICEPDASEFIQRIETYVKNPSLLERHAEISRKIVSPLSASGTAILFAGIIEKYL